MYNHAWGRLFEKPLRACCISEPWMLAHRDYWYDNETYLKIGSIITQKNIKGHFKYPHISTEDDKSPFFIHEWKSKKMLHSWQIIGSVSFTLKSRYNQNLEQAKIHLPLPPLLAYTELPTKDETVKTTWNS